MERKPYMITLYINGNEYHIPKGEHINVIQAAMRFGVEIPYYCWHPALSVVANCRMCEIEVGSRDPKTGEIKMVPKLVPACQTPAKDMTVIVTDSAKVKEHHRMIMELLLINHPLDCPVCDQAGECGLQDFSYDHGQATHRYVETRNVKPKKSVSPAIELNQDRCIMCTRCVRFTREITRTGELQVMRRGDHAEIAVFADYPLDNPLAGNVVDLCPVGALLDRDFLHKQRVWFLSKHDAVCTRCATGCNISSEENKGALWRFKPRYNPHVNDYWMCDEGRYSYKAANDPGLLSAMYLRRDGKLSAAPVDQALSAARSELAARAGEGAKLVGVVSPFATVEEAFLFATYMKKLSPSAVLALGPVPVRGADETILPDKTKGRTGDTSFVVCRPFTISAEKCPNRRGVEIVLEHYQGEVIGCDAIVERIGAGEFDAAFVYSGSIDPAFDEAASAKIRSGVQYLVVEDVNVTPLAQSADVVLAGATFAEKAGSYVNAQGRLQYSAAALPPRDGSLPDLDILAILSDRPGGPQASFGVLAEAAATIAALAPAGDGRPAEFGVALDQPANGAATREYAFADPWTGARR